MSSAHALEQRRYRVAHPDRVRESKRRSYEKHKAEVKKTQALYRKANAERRRDVAAKYREANREALREYNRAYRAAHPEKTYAVVRKWIAAHPGVTKVYGNRRRTRLAQGSGTHTVREWIALGESVGWGCHYCGTVLSRRAAVQEHKTPLVRGGSNSIDNIAVSCRPCNLKKGRKTEAEFRRLG